MLVLLVWLDGRKSRAQRVLLGGGDADLVDFAITLQSRVDDLHRAVDEIAAALARVDRRLDETLAKTRSCATTRTRTAGGISRRRSRCSTRIAPVVVLTAIQGRDYARIYMKELDRGKACVALSPEEQQAVERATTGRRFPDSVTRASRVAPPGGSPGSADGRLGRELGTRRDRARAGGGRGGRVAIFSAGCSRFSY